MSEKLHISITANADNAIKEIDNVNKKINSTVKNIAQLDKQKIGNFAENTGIEDTKAKLDEMKQGFIEQLRELETYKNLGLDVSSQLKTKWEEYLLWISEQYQKDSFEYIQAVAMKKQAEDIWYNESKKKVINHSKLSKASYNSIAAGFDEMFTSMLKIEAKGNSLLEKGFVAMANTFVREVSRMMAKWLAFQAIKTVFSPFSFLGFAGGGNVKTFATGGFVSGTGTASSDSIPAFLSNGEFVVNASSAKNNLDLLNEINSSNTGNISNKLNELIASVNNLKNRAVEVYLDPDEIIEKANPIAIFNQYETGSYIKQRW